MLISHLSLVCEYVSNVNKYLLGDITWINVKETNQ